MSDTQPPLPRKRGCFFYGCITCLVLLFLLVVGMFFTVRFAVNRLNRLVVEYTDRSAVSLPKTAMPAEEVKQLNDKVAAFNNALDAHSNAPPLILTAPEINVLLASSPQLKDYKDKFYVSLDGDTIRGQVSLPLDGWLRIPMVETKGRYLNGSGTFKASVNNGNLSVFVEDLEVRGKPLPAEFVKGLKQQNLAQGFNNNTNGPPFQKYQSVQVKDGTVIIKGNDN